jgi:hypothetical protein
LDSYVGCIIIKNSIQIATTFFTTVTMVLEVGDDERILFRASCQFEGVLGTLVITNVRLHWSSVDANGAADFQTPWSNVQKVQYTPAKIAPKAGMNVYLNVNVNVGKASVMFMLQGSDRVQQLQLLKGHVADAIKGFSSSTAATTTAPQVQSQPKKRRVQDMLDSHSDEAVRTAELDRRRKELLESDSALSKHYKQLCSGQAPILSEEEFWLAHMPEYATELFRRDTDDYAQRGRLPLKSRVPNPGEGTLTLTPDDIRRILEEDPIIRRAHMDLVPHQKTEVEFWNLYVQKYYHRTLQSGQADQLFARYERKIQPKSNVKQTMKNTATAGNTEASSATASSSRATGHWKEDSALSLIDSFADSDHPERYDGEDACHTFGEGVSRIVSESGAIASAVGRAAITDTTAATQLRQQQYSITELQAKKEDLYIPLNLKQINVPVIETKAQEAKPASGGFGKRPAGGFGKSSGARGPSRAAAKEPFPDPKTLLNNLDNVIPDKSRAEAYLNNTRALLRSSSDNTRKKETSSLSAALEMQRDIDAFGIDPQEAELPVVDLTNQIKDGVLLPHDFKVHMSETFTAIVEYLRHMYMLMARDDSASQIKITKILEHLELIWQKLTSKKNKHKVDTSMSIKVRDAATRVIDELLKLITRAKTRAAAMAKDN